MMKQQSHILDKIPDYVLGLLPDGERAQLEQHTFSCANCRQALRLEGEFEQVVRSTLIAASPPPANLRQFMPAAPPRRPFLLSNLTWQKQLAPAAVFIILLLGSLSFFLAEQRAIWSSPSPTYLAVTATMTDEPTATITETRAEQVMLPRETTVSTAPIRPQIAITPPLIPHPSPPCLPNS